MRLTPLPLEIGEYEGFTEQNDIFGYKAFGENLARLVSTIDEPLVLLLDSPWGSGKSTFIRQWAGLLRNQGVPVIYFDAFANDHQEDAFLTLAAEISAHAQEVLGEASQPEKNFTARAKKVGRVLMPLAVRAVVRGATAGLMSSDDVKDAGEAVKAAFEAGSKAAEEQLEKLIAERLQHAHADRAALDGFRESLTVLSKALSEKRALDQSSKASKEDDEQAGNVDSRRPPLVFIIDELDRCRPPFALNILERIKHVFSVDGVCFVLVSDLRQLQAAVQGRYGSGIDARVYLEKFFQLRVSLPDRRDRGPGIRRRYIEYLWSSMRLDPGEHEFDMGVKEGLAEFSERLSLSLRRIERIVGHIALVYAASSPGSLRLPVIVVPLCVLRQVEPEIYRKASDGTLRWEDVRDSLGISEWPQGGKKEWYEHWWKYFTLENLPPEPWVANIKQSLFRYPIDDDVNDRRAALRYLAGLIDGLHRMDE
jgi:hypothetical protein